jgi:rRNA maturation RNase YbeY
MRKTRSKKPVDVLAFPEPKVFPHPERRHPSLGEVYLNWDLNRNHPERLAFLLVHGILHLAGYRHKKRHDSMVMETLEKKLWHRVSSLV